MRSNFAPGALGTLPVTRRPVRGWRSIRSASRPAGIAPRRARARHRTLVSEIDSDSSCSTETLDVRRPPQQLPVLVPVDVHVSFRDFPERVVRPSERRVAGACHHRPYVAEPLGSHRSVSGEVVAAEDMVPVSAGAASPPPFCSETARTPFGRTCDCASSRPRSRAFIAALLDSACGGLSCPRAVSFSPGASSRASLSRVARFQSGPPRSSPASTCGVISIGISPPTGRTAGVRGSRGRCPTSLHREAPSCHWPPTWAIHHATASNTTSRWPSLGAEPPRRCQVVPAQAALSPRGRIGIRDAAANLDACARPHPPAAFPAKDPLTTGPDVTRLPCTHVPGGAPRVETPGPKARPRAHACHQADDACAPALAWMLAAPSSMGDDRDGLSPAPPPEALDRLSDTASRRRRSAPRSGWPAGDPTALPDVDTCERFTRSRSTVPA